MKLPCGTKQVSRHGQTRCVSSPHTYNGLSKSNQKKHRSKFLQIFSDTRRALLNTHFSMEYSRSWPAFSMLASSSFFLSAHPTPGSDPTGRSSMMLTTIDKNTTARHVVNSNNSKQQFCCALKNEAHTSKPSHLNSCARLLLKSYSTPRG